MVKEPFDISVDDFSWISGEIKPVVPKTELDRRQFLTSVAAGPETGQTVRAELETSSTSPTQDRLNALFKEQQTVQVRQQLESIIADPNIPKQEKIQQVQAAQSAIDSPLFEESVIDRAKRNLTALNNIDSVSDLQAQDALVDHYHELAKVDAAINEAANTLTWNTDKIGLPVDVTIGILAPWYDQNIKDVLNEVVPGFVTTTGRLPWPLSDGAGDLKVRWKAHLDSLSPEEKVLTVRRLAEAIENNPVFGNDNGYTKMVLWQELVQDIDSASAHRVSDNIFGSLDYIGLGIIKGAGILGAKALRRVMLGKKVTDTIATEKVVATVTGHEKVVHELKTSLEKKLDKALNNTLENKPVGSTASVIEQVAPTTAREIQIGALQDTTGETAKSIGATNPQIANDGLLPNPPNTNPGITPSLHSLNDTMVDLDPGRQFFTEAEIRGAEGTLNERLESLASVSPNIHLHKMETDIIPGGYRANYHIYDTPSSGFTSQKMAMDTAKTFKEFSDTSTELMVRNYTDDEFVPLSQAKKEGWFDPKRKNEYSIRLSVEERLMANHALDDVPIFTGNNVVGRLAAWADKSATFVSWLVNAGNVATDQRSAKLGAMTRMLKPMTILKQDDQAKVIKMLDEGDRQKEWWSDVELLNVWQNEPNAADLIAGYKAVLHHNQVVYKEINKRARAKLANENYKHVILPKEMFGDNFSQMGKYVGRNELKTVAGDDFTAKTHVPRDIRRIYDANKKQVLNVDSKMLDDMAEDTANKFIKLHTPVWIDKQQIRYIFLKNGEGLKVKNLPKYVVRNERGYISRVYDSSYILRQVKGGLADGYYQQRASAIRMYATRGEMLRDLAKLHAEEEIKHAADPKYKIKKYIPTDARELQADKEYANRTSLEYLQDSGMLFTSRRGQEVFGIDGARRLKSISDSLQLSRNVAASANTVEPLVDKLTKNWELKYGKKFSTNGKMPWREQDLTRVTSDIRKTADFGEALALQRHIKLLAGVDDSAVTHAFRNFMINFSEHLSTRWDNAFVNKIAEGLVNHRRKNPINGVKGAAFTHFIIFNPIRQLVMQAQQMSMYLGIEGAMKYFLTKGIPEYGALMHGNVWRHTKMWDEVKHVGAKMAGMDVKEYEKFIDAYKKTGLPDSIDHHMYSVMTNVERSHLGSPTALGLNPWIDKPLTVWRNVKRVARRIGFDAGEQSQLMAGYLAARNRWMIRNPKIAHLWAEDDNLLKIAGDARAISLNMNESGMLQSQKGLLGMIMQFMSHATKSFQVLIPNTTKAGSLAGLSKFSNKAFSNQEKAAIFANQMVLYGVGAFGLNQMYESFVANLGIEVPPEVNSKIEEGLIGTLINLSFAAMGDEDPGELSTDLDVSSSIAPFSGIGGRSQIVGMGNPLGWLINAMFIQDMTLAEAVGPATLMIERADKAISFAATVAGAVPDPEIGTDAFMAILNETGKQMLPIFNNFMQARIEDTVDRHITASGNLGTEVTDGETWARAILGFNTKRQREVSTDLMEVRGLMGNPKKEGLKSELNEVADDWYKFALYQAVQIADGKEDFKARHRDLKNIGTILKASLGEDEYRYVMNRVRDKYTSLESGGPENELYRNLLRIGGDIPSILDPSFATEINNQPNFKHKDRILQWLEDIK